MSEDPHGVREVKVTIAVRISGGLEPAIRGEERTHLRPRFKGVLRVCGYLPSNVEVPVNPYCRKHRLSLEVDSRGWESGDKAPEIVPFEVKDVVGSDLRRPAHAPVRVPLEDRNQ